MAARFCHVKTMHHFKIRCEHLAFSALTGAKLLGNEDSGIKEHPLVFIH